MIGFFRRIRRELANENRLFKYSRYAFGEIVLVVIGILIALQINNWNEKRKQEKVFKSFMEQVFTSLTEDLVTMENNKSDFENEIDEIDSLFSNPDLFRKDQLPALVYAICWGKYEPKDLITPDLITNFEIDSENMTQKALYLRVRRFNFLINNGIRGFDDLRIIKLLADKHNIYPPLPAHWENNYSDIGIGFYSDDQLDRMADLMTDEALIREINMAKSGKVVMIETLKNQIAYTTDLIKAIKMYYPDIGLIYNEVGIIGSSLKLGWDASVPMIVDMKDPRIWSLQVYLQKGEVKFRTHNNWVQNWGGETFPEGETKWHGQNIPIEVAGEYEVTLDLNNGTYHFELLE